MHKYPLKPLKSKNRVYIKTPSLWFGKRLYSDLTREQSFNLERKCLKRVNKHYECICGLGLKTKHFPTILDTNPKMLSITMTHMGPSVKSLKKQKKHVNIKNKEEQIRCIIHNLKKASVCHLDFHPTGKNTCVNKDGVLALIDFDIAIIKTTPDDKIYPNIGKLKRKYARFGKDYETNAFNAMMKCTR